MPGTVPRPLIAVMDSSADLVSLLQTALEGDGFRTVTHVSTVADGVAGQLAFLHRYRPVATVYSVSPPYRAGWDTLQEIRQQWAGGRYVITTTNLGALRACVGPADAIEFIGKPLDLDAITQALRHALTAPHAPSDARAISSGTARSARHPAGKAAVL
jgi:DNA-binding NtrC family response regulator